MDDQGAWLFAGRQMTGFSDEDEWDLGKAGNALWLFAWTLSEMEATYTTGTDREPYLVQDSKLISGQPAQRALRVARTDRQ